MNSMAIDRRGLLLGTLAFVGASRVSGPGAANDAAQAVTYVSAAKRASGDYCVVLLASDGRLLRHVPLSARGHDIAIHRPTRRAVAIARRPGTFAVAFELDTMSAPRVIAAADGRHFYGHGAFSVDGRLLYLSENDIAGARGVIGIYDVARAYKRIGEHPSHGLGPHEIILLADGRTLAVANGGLDTVPEAGRENLNVEAMQPSLTFVDAETGALRNSFRLGGDLQSLSLRHLAADAQGQIWFGGQWEGDPTRVPQLVGNAGLDREPRLIEAAPDLKGYVGSMAVSADGRVIAASSPKAGRVIFIDAEKSQLIAQSDLKDACGIAPDGNANFAATSGLGVVRHETKTAAIISESELKDIAFDNHLRRTA